MVVLTLFITSSVSFTYSSSEAANAAGVSGKSHAGEDRVAAAAAATNDKNSRRRACGIVGVAVAVVVDLVDLIGGRDLSLEVGVRSVGEAMVGGGGREDWGGERECVCRSNQ